MQTEPSLAQAANEPSNQATDALVASMLERISGGPTSGPLSGVIAEAAEVAPVKETKVDPVVEEAAPVEKVDLEPEPEVVEETTEEPEPEAEEAPEGEKPPVKPAAKEPERFRFKDDEDKAVALLAKAKGISLVKAATLYASLNAEEVPPETTPVTQSPSTPEVKALETKVAELDAKLESLGENNGLLDGEAIKLFKEHAKAVSDLGRAMDRAEAQAGSVASVVQQQERAFAETVKAYPAMADSESPQYLLAAQLADRAARDQSHPDHLAGQQPDAPRYFADKAAEKLKMPPAKAKAAPVETAPAATPGKPKPGPVAGTRGTIPPPAEKPIADRVTEARARTLSMIGGGGGESDSDVMVM